MKNGQNHAHKDALRPADAVLDFILSHGGRTSDQPVPDRPARPRSSRTPKRSTTAQPLRFIDLFCGPGGFSTRGER